MTTNDKPVEELGVEECWELLQDEQFGRLAYRLVDEVHLVPINYAVDGRSLLFRTASGNKLLAAALESDVAFEIDWHDDLTAWSVVARGTVAPAWRGRGPPRRRTFPPSVGRYPEP